MKALVRNDLYSVQTSLKVTLGMVLTCAVAIFIIRDDNSVFYNYIEYFNYAVGGVLAGTSFTMMYNDINTKWLRFELTAALTKKDVVTARYISYFILSGLGVASCLFTSFICCICGLEVSMQEITMSIAAIVVISLLIPSILYPMILKFGIDKAQLAYLGTVLFVVIFFVASAKMFDAIADIYPLPDGAFRLGMITLSVTLMLLSYVISKKMYIKMDL